MNSRRFGLLCLVCILMATGSVHALGKFTIFDKAQGLASDRLGAIVEDAGGQLWVAVRDAGLARFDGSKFTMVGKKEGLQSLQVHDLALDSKQKLVAATAAGIFRLEGQRFTAVAKVEGVVRVAADPAGGLWFAAGGEYLPKSLGYVAGGKAKSLPTPKGAACRNLVDLFATGPGEALLVCQTCILHGKKGKVKALRLKGTPLYKAVKSERRMPPVRIHGAARQGDRIWFVGLSKKVALYEKGKFRAGGEGHFGRVSAGGSVAYAASFDGNLYRLTGKSPLKVYPPAGAKTRDISLLMVDRAGTGVYLVHHATTSNVFLVRLSPDGKVSKWALKRPDKGVSIHPGADQIYEDRKGQIWLTTSHGLWRVD